MRTSRAVRFERAAGAVFTYEAVALLSGGRLPTISRIATRHTWISVVVVGCLIAHLAQPRRPARARL